MNKFLQKYLNKLSKAGKCLDFASVPCKYGNISIYCLVGPEEKIIHLSFTPEKHEQAQKQLASLGSNIVFSTLQQKNFHYNTVFNDYFTGNLTRFPMKADSPFVDAGTPFQQRIWQCISAIPYGSTISYQGLAEMAGCHKGFRAAGMACGANPLALIIPCHRVVAKNGLGGFAGGVAIKRTLLALEQGGATARDKKAVFNHC